VARVQSVRWPLVIVVAVLAGCARPATPAPPVPSQAPVSAAALPQAGLSGDTLTIATATGTAAYTVGNLRPVPAAAQIIPARGAMYSVDVRITAQSGTTIVNGFYFVARSATGATIAPAVGAVRPAITSGRLTEGQSVEGIVAFDVPAGTAIAAVTLRDPHGERLAAWSVS